MTPIARTQLADVALSAWTDISVSPYVDAGNTAGIVLEIVNPTATERNWGARKNGSSDVITGGMEDTGHTWVVIGVDGNDIFEFWMDNTAIDLFIVGYILNSEGAFFTNAVDKSLSATGAWTDMDLASDTGGDTALCAFFLIDNLSASFSYTFGLRENSSTDNRIADIFNADLRGAMMSVDGSEVLEGWIQNTSVNFLLTGYLTANFTSFTNAKDYSTGTSGSYVDANFSSDIPVGNNGAFFQMFNSGAQDINDEKHNIRKKGDSWDSYYDITMHQYGWTEIDTNRVAEQKIETTEMDLWLWGFTDPGGASITKIVAETYQFSESRLRLGASARVRNETYQLSEGLIRKGASTRLVSETLNWGEVLIRKLALVRIVAETLQFGEGIIRKLASLRLINETVQLSENLVRKLASIKLVSETVQLSENVLKWLGIFKLVNEVTQWSEGVLRRSGFVKLVNETLTWGEGLLRRLSSLKLVSETVQFSENLIRKLVSIHLVNETLQWSENILRRGASLRLVNETLQWGEGVLRRSGFVKLINETVSWGESTIRKGVSIRLINETVQFGESFIRRLSSIRLVTETVSFIENTIYQRGIKKVINETLSWIENIIKVLAGVSQVLDLFKPQLKSLKQKYQLKSLKQRFQIKWLG